MTRADTAAARHAAATLATWPQHAGIATMLTALADELDATRAALPDADTLGYIGDTLALHASPVERDMGRFLCEVAERIRALDAPPATVAGAGE